MRMRHKKNLESRLEAVSDYLITVRNESPNFNDAQTERHLIDLKEHFRKYSSPDIPPVWKTLEAPSFATLSKLFCNLNDNRVKKQIARLYNLPQHQVLESWIKCIVILRNCIVHRRRDLCEKER